MARLRKRRREKYFQTGILRVRKCINNDSFQGMKDGKQDKLKRFETTSTEFLREEGIYGDVEANALKHVIAAALAQRMEKMDLTISELAKQLGTSRAAVNRILDPLNTSLTLNTLAKTAAVLGCKVKLEIVVPR
jgi:antitoxin HicB